MIRGTTAQFKFKLPYDVCNISVVKVTFWQTGNNGPSASRPLPIVKTMDQCSKCNASNELLVVLNKEETLRFSDKLKAYVQFHGKTLEGTAFANEPELIPVCPICDDSVLDDVVIPTPGPEDDIIILDGSIIE